MLPILLLSLPLLGNIFALSHCTEGVGKTIQCRPCTNVWQRSQAQGNKQKQKAATADSNLIAINFSLVHYGVVQNTARRIDCPQTFIRTFGYWKDTELLHVYYAQKGYLPSGACMYAGY
jgi:hypothetical protein